MIGSATPPFVAPSGLRIATGQDMTTAISLIASLYLLGLIMLTVGILHAPEGYEDESGLHAIWINHSPGLKNVSTTWS